MKPESHRALMELISYGVEELSSEEAAQLMSRVQECQECTGQWVLFQKTYTVLSQTGQTEISVERSQQMWLACLEHARHNNHKLHEVPARSPQSEVLPVSFRSDSHSSQREGDRRSPFAPLAALQTLKQALAPRWSYGLALGAFALLATAYFASPQPQPTSSSSTQNVPQVVSLRPFPALPRFVSDDSSQAPPFATTGMIEYHSAMGFEPFSDHLAPGLISTSAKTP